MSNLELCDGFQLEVELIEQPRPTCNTRISEVLLSDIFTILKFVSQKNTMISTVKLLSNDKLIPRHLLPKLFA